MMTGTKFDIKKFDGMNDFGLWHVRIKALLEQQGLAAALEQLLGAIIVAYDNVIKKGLQRIDLVFGYVPELKRNLISLGTLKKEGFTVKMQLGKIKVMKGSLVVLSETRRANYVYTLDGQGMTKKTLKGRKQLRGFQTRCKIKKVNVIDCNQGSRKSGVAKHLGVAGIHQQNGLVEETNMTLLAKTPIDMLGFLGWLASIKQWMLKPVKVKCIFMRFREGIVGDKLWRLADVTSMVVLHKNIGFNKSGEYKKTFIGYGVGTGSMQVLHRFEFEVEPLGDHTFEVEPQENVDQEASLQEKAWIFGEMCVCSATVVEKAVTTVRTITGSMHQGLMFKAKGSVLGLEIIKDQSVNTLRVSQSRIHNESPIPSVSTIHADPPSSPRYPPPVLTPTSGAQRRIGIAVDLSDESAFAVQWAVQNYLRPGDAVILLHIRPTSVLYGADWGYAMDPESQSEESQKKLEDDFDKFTNTKTTKLSQPLVEANVPFKIHIVKDHDLKERLCLEVERLGLCAMIMGSRGFGAVKRTGKSHLGSVSDYCVRHCVCPVVVVRYSDAHDGGDASDKTPFQAVKES
nr:universal stress protein PHOS32-like [Tanacetum cinerariifolium]